MYIPARLKIKNFLSFKEQEFEFRQGEALLVVGDNCDQLSQRGNGSGKSAFIEAIAVAISGKPLRDVLTKELIFNGEESAEVTLVLENAILNHTLILQRVIYANTTPAVYNALIDKKEQGKHYADWNQFNDWVFKTIGISKDDFFGNYLVTDDNYEPFLRIGDTKKKEFVNRFSGANVVDKVFPGIQADSAKIGLEIEELNKSVLQNQTKQSVFADQIQELNDEVDPVKIAEQIKEKENEVSEEQEEQAQKKDQRTNLNSEIIILEKQIKKWKYSKDFDKLIDDLNKSSEQKSGEVKSLSQQLTTVKDKFQSKIQAVNTREQELKKQKQQLQADIEEHEEFESDTNKHLQDSITCPKCKHVFCLRDQEYDLEAAKENLPQVIEAIAEFKEDLKKVNEELNNGIQQRRTALNQEINKAQEKINDQVKILNTEISTISSNVRDLQNAMGEETRAKKKLDNDLTDKQRILKNLDQDIEELDIEILQLKHDITSLQNSGINQKRLDELNKSIEKLVKEETTLRNQLELKRKEKERIDTWELNFIKFKSFLANKSIKNIQDYTNIFLTAMASDLSIEMTGYRPLANKKKIKEEITTIVKRNGYPTGSYGKFSGGERGRIDISVILANQELINLNCEHGKGLGFLFIDEILDQMDSLGLELLIDSLQNLNKTIMIVSQQTELNNISEHTLIVRKKNKTSTIVC